MDVVDQIGEVTLRQRRLRGNRSGGPLRWRDDGRLGFGASLRSFGFLDGELRDDLEFAFIEELKIFLPQVPYSVAITVADYCRHRH